MYKRYSTIDQSRKTEMRWVKLHRVLLSLFVDTHWTIEIIIPFKEKKKVLFSLLLVFSGTTDLSLTPSITLETKRHKMKPDLKVYWLVNASSFIEIERTVIIQPLKIKTSFLNNRSIDQHSFEGYNNLLLSFRKKDDEATRTSFSFLQWWCEH